jgi:hypothetical protein
MTQRTSGRLAAAIALGLIGVAFSSATQATHSWNNYHWARNTTQFTLPVGDNTTTKAWKKSLTNSSADWNSDNGPLLVSVVGGSTNSQSCSMVAGTTQVCNFTYGSNGWLGLATINITGGVHITQGTAKMNDTYFNQAFYNNKNEKRHVMCQEVAHTFGLDHQSTSGQSLDTCMDYFSNTGANAGSTLSTRPNAHDFAELRTIYAHLDGAEFVAPEGRSDSAVVDITNDPSSWGQLLRQSPDGRSSVYERHNIDGSKTVTHVYWTREAAEFCATCDHRSAR